MTDTTIQQKANVADVARRLLTDACELRTKLANAALDTPATQNRKVAEFIDKRRPEVLRRIDAERVAGAELIAGIEGAIHKPLKDAAERGPFAAEIRASLRQMPEADRNALIEERLKAGDVATIGAALGAPAHLSGLTEGTHALLLRKYKLVTNPEGVKRAEQLSKAQERLDTAGSLTLAETEKLIDRNALKSASKAEAEVAALVGRA